MQFYVIIDGNKSGPFSAYDLNGLVREGKVTAESLAWHAGMEVWLPMGEMPALEMLFKAPDPIEVFDFEVSTAASAAPVLSNLRPWRRFFARMIDLQFFYIIVSLVMVKMDMIKPIEFYVPKNPGTTVLVVVALWVVVESMLLVAFGTTLGKFALGIRIKLTSGEPIKFSDAIKRSSFVWWRGCGFGLQLLNTIAAILSFFHLTKFGKTPWDSACGFSVEHGQIKLLRIFLLLFLFISLAQMMYSIVGDPPPEMIPNWLPTPREVTETQP
jgi:hypothetical protein